MWYTKFGPSGDVVLSSRVRLARNIKDIPFGKKMKPEQEEEVLKRCRQGLPKMKYIDMNSMSEAERKALAECHLISPEMAECRDNCGILLSDDCRTSIMLNEEDHIRIQCMEPGFDLDACMRAADEYDDELEKTVDYGFDEKFGYLTCCPTNVGTGMRASVMVHLPALTASGRMENIIRSLSKLGIVVRGIYGEGSRAFGNIYQISNQVTLGVSEDETLEKLKNVTIEVVEKERELSRKMYESDKYRFEDKVMRSYGILTSARVLPSEEAMNLFSDVRWGVNMGIIKNVNLEKLSEVLYETLPANMMKKYNLSDPLERDLKRAEIFREKVRETADKG